MSLTAFIDDGYNRDGKIAAAPRLWPEINFTYRPMTAAEFSEISLKNKALDDAAWHRAIAGSVAKKLVTWDVKNSRDESVDVSEANVMRLVHPVLLRLWEIITSAKADDGTDEGNLPAG